MAHRKLGKVMEGTEPANDPSPSFETLNTGKKTYYAYNKLDPDRLEYILRMADNRGRVDMLYKLYSDMETTDTRYSGILNQVRSTIARMPIRVIPTETETQRDEEVANEYREYAREIIERLDDHDLSQSFVEPYVIGAALYNVKWEQEDLPFNRSMWFPENIEQVNGRHLIEDTNTQSDTYGELKVRTNDEPSGIPIPELPEDNHIFLELNNGQHSYSQLGVARKVLPWYLSLRYVKDWWVQYVENYGQPTRIAKYPRATKRDTRNKIQKFLKSIGQNQYGLFPQGTQVELLDLNRQGKVNVHREFIREAHKEYSIHILGQAGTTGEQREGSYAESVVLNGIRMDIMWNVAKLVSKGFERLVNKGLRLNYGNEFKEHFAPEIKPVLLNSQNAKQRAQAAKIAAQMDVDVPTSFIYNQVLGVEKPQEGEETVSADDLSDQGGSPTQDSSPSQSQNNDTGDTSVAQDGTQEGSEQQQE